MRGRDVGKMDLCGRRRFGSPAEVSGSPFLRLSLSIPFISSPRANRMAG